MLAPMALAKPQKAWYYAFITTFSSTVGGVFGYLVGMFLIGIIYPYLTRLGYAQHYQLAQAWFERWGFWALFVAGFAPIPYKLFTIAAGAVKMSLFPFIIASFLGRGVRFFLIALIVSFGGEKLEEKLRHAIDWIGWSVLFLIILALIIWH